MAQVEKPALRLDMQRGHSGLLDACHTADQGGSPAADALVRTTSAQRCRSQGSLICSPLAALRTMKFHGCHLPPVHPSPPACPSASTHRQAPGAPGEAQKGPAGQAHVCSEISPVRRRRGSHGCTITCLQPRHDQSPRAPCIFSDRFPHIPSSAGNMAHVHIVITSGALGLSLGARICARASTRSRAWPFYRAASSGPLRPDARFHHFLYVLHSCGAWLGLPLRITCDALGLWGGLWWGSGGDRRGFGPPAAQDDCLASIFAVGGRPPGSFCMCVAGTERMLRWSFGYIAGFGY